MMKKQFSTGSESCPQTNQRGTEDSPDGCADKQEESDEK